MYLSLVKQAVFEAWGESRRCVFTHCWEVFKHASLRDVTSLPSGFPGHTLSLSPRGFYVGTCSGAGNRPKVSICLLVFQWLLTLLREIVLERNGKKSRQQRELFRMTRYLSFKRRSESFTSTFEGGEYVCFLSPLPAAVTHTLTPSVSHLFLLRVCVSCIMQVYFKQTGTLKRVRDSYTNENVVCVCESCVY